jgi:Spy/CpxP family protein refolding chaperone
MKSPRLSRAATALVACAVAVVLAPRFALAQGTNGALPDPISSRELLTYAERLRLSSAQRTAIEQVHDDYREEFRALREGEIANLLGRVDVFQGSVPKRKDVEPLMKDLDRLADRIRAIDDRFFDRIGPLLSEEQFVLLPRIRLARERYRYQTVQTTGMIRQAGRMPVELGTILAGLDLSPEVRAAVDPALEGFEMRLTRALREVNESVSSMMLDAVTQFEEAGLTDIDFSDMASMSPEQLQAFQQTMTTVWATLQAKILEQASELAEIDDRGFRAIHASLPESVGRDFKAEYHAEAYPDAAFTRPQIDRRGLERSLAGDEVTEEQRQALRALYEEYRDRLDTIANDAVTMIKEARPKLMSTMSWDGGGNMDAWTEYHRRLGEYQQMVAALTEDIARRGRELVGPDLYDSIAHRAARGAGSDEMAVAEAAAVPQTVNADPAEFATIDMLLAPRISRADIARYAERLGGDDATRDLLNAVHIDYVQRFESLDAITRLTEASRRVWRTEDGVVLPPSAEDLEALARQRRAAIDAVLATDDAFFDDVKTVVEEARHPTIEELRRERRRQVYRPPQAMQVYGFGSVSSASGVDLLEVVDGLRLAPPDRAIIDPILDDYAERTTPILRDRLMAQIELQLAMDGWTSRMSSNDAEEGVAQWQTYQTAMQAPTERVSGFAKAIETANRETADKLTSALAGESGARLRDAFRRRAYPEIYADPIAVHEQITRALALDDVTAAQREQLTDLALSYRPRYEDLSERLIAITSSRMDLVTFEADDWREFQQRERERERLVYDRNELSFRAIGRLRTILSEAQIGRIGGLPAIPDDK